MKKRKISVLTLVSLMVLTSFLGIYPKIVTPLPPPQDNSFIADIFPSNNNTHIELLNVSALIAINASDFYNGIELTFNGNYTIFNPGNMTDLTLYLPFSLCLDFEDAMFGVSVNNTQVFFEIATTTVDELTNSGFKIEFVWYLFYLPCPVRLITFNLTLQEKCTYIVNYQLSGWIYDPLSDGDVLSMIYTSGPTRFWKGNASERVEYKIFGRIPVFGWGGGFHGTFQILDIDGGKRFINEYDNAQTDPLAIRITYDDRIDPKLYPNSGLVNLLFIYLFYAILIGSIVSTIIIRPKRRKL